MAGKNHPRYKLRKKMNTIKHEVKSLFNEPPTFIHNWEELSQAKSNTHIIEIDPDMCSGWVRPKFELSSDDDYYTHNVYLSTHTFYGNTYFISTATLRRLDFNVQLINWDGETICCKQ